MSDVVTQEKKTGEVYFRDELRLKTSDFGRGPYADVYRMNAGSTNYPPP